MLTIHISYVCVSMRIFPYTIMICTCKHLLNLVRHFSHSLVSSGRGLQIVFFHSSMKIIRPIRELHSAYNQLNIKYCSVYITFPLPKIHRGYGVWADVLTFNGILTPAIERGHTPSFNASKHSVSEVVLRNTF